MPGIIPNMTGKEPVEFFELFFDEETKRFIHRETCEHADRYFTDNEEYLVQHPRARAHDWKKNPMSLKEIDVLLALVTAMGVVGMPTLRSDKKDANVFHLPVNFQEFLEFYVAIY